MLGDGLSDSDEVKLEQWERRSRGRLKIHIPESFSVEKMSRETYCLSRNGYDIRLTF